jgi:hypothetical protein
LRKLCKYLRLSGVSRRDDFELHLAVIADNLTGPGGFYELERHFWIDLWRVPVFEAIALLHGLDQPDVQHRLAPIGRHRSMRSEGLAAVMM